MAPVILVSGFTKYSCPYSLHDLQSYCMSFPAFFPARIHDHKIARYCVTKNHYSKSVHHHKQS